MSAGIAAQYGFLYQRYVFIKLALENAGMNKFLTYEGLDDVNISEEHGISSIKEFGGIYAQVKSGTISRDCWAKVIGNWLLSDTNISEYRLIIENALSFDIKTDEVVNDICDYFHRGAGKTVTSIANKVYKKFLADDDKSIEVFKARISGILDKVTIEVLPLDVIKIHIEEIFKTVYCSDIKIYKIAKVCRCKRFIEYVNAGIDGAIERKKSYILRFVDLMNIINKVSSEISDGKYSVDISVTKKRKKPEAERLMKNVTIREVRQLRMVSSNSDFIVHELLNELLYRDFRNVCSQSEETLISNIEETAYSNFEDTLFSLAEDSTPKQLFECTVGKAIPLSIVDNSSIYQHGCYVFLTGENIDESKQITWGKEHE